MSTSAKILLAEDDQNLGFVISDQLSEEGFDVNHVSDGKRGLDTFTREEYDLCIVDVMMPEMDGFHLAEKIRQIDEFVPIIFLTARAQEEDRLRGFEVGGDDYVVKPFSMAELIYRVQVFLRRKGASRVLPLEVMTIGQFSFDQKNLELKSKDSTINLTQREAELLSILLANQGEIVKREEILVKLWGENDYFKGRSLDVFISRLRKYLKSDSNLEIRNHHGVGFTLFDKNLSG